MNTTRKIITSAFLASVLAASVSLSASAEEPGMEHNADENIEIVKINEPDISNRFMTNPDTIVVVNENDGNEASDNSIEPRTYTFYSYTGEGTKALTKDGAHGIIPIVARVYERAFNPVGSTYQRYCGVEAKIEYDKSTGESLKTNITIEGKLFRNGQDGIKISASGFTDLLRAELKYSDSTDTSNCFDFCQSTVTTTSPAFGTSSQECNFIVIPSDLKH